MDEHLNQNEEPVDLDKNSITYKAVSLLGVIVILCVAALLIAMTVKTVMWIIGL